jgi:hypothetical protein
MAIYPVLMCIEWTISHYRSRLTGGLTQTQVGSYLPKWPAQRSSVDGAAQIRVGEAVGGGAAPLSKTPLPINLA